MSDELWFVIEKQSKSFSTISYIDYNENYFVVYFNYLHIVYNDVIYNKKTVKIDDKVIFFWKRNNVWE